jgi:hypothetical protein
VAELAAGRSYNLGDCHFVSDILLTGGLVADAEMTFQFPFNAAKNVEEAMQ